VTFDPGLLELAGGGGSESSSGPGRTVLKLDAGQGGGGAESSIRFRVIAKRPTTTQLALENVIVEDAAGRAIPSQAPKPIVLTVVQ
jgi:hypothetical protein